MLPRFSHESSSDKHPACRLTHSVYGSRLLFLRIRSGLVSLIVGLYFVTDLAPFFTQAAQDVFVRTNDPAVQIPQGFQGGALDFASSIFSWLIFHAVYNFKIVGSSILVIVALAMAIYNRRRIIKEAKHIEE